MRMSLCALGLTLGLAGCSGLQSPATPADNLEPIIVRVSGFGTYAQKGDAANPRKHLMAMRASKLDAYRSLAERVYGTVIYGSSTVNDFVLQDDAFRAYVDSYIRGAKVVAVTDRSDGTVETIMQLKLEPRFRACVAETDPALARTECPIPMPTSNDSAGDLEATSKVDSMYYME